MIELFYSKGVCSLAPHILLYETETPHTLVNIPLDGTQKKPEYLAVNPKGAVPAIRIEKREVLTEVGTILQFIADLQPAKKLMPSAGTMERYRAQEWLNYIATEVHKGIGGYFAIGRMTNDQTKTDMREASDKKTKTTFEFIAPHLAKHPFLMGETMTAPDAYLFTILNWTKFLKIDLSPYPSLMAFQERMTARPSVQKAMKAEGLA